MTLLIALIVQVLHVLLMLATAPLALGLSRTLSARIAGRSPPPPSKPWQDLIRLGRKQTLFSEQSHGLFEAAPIFSFAATVLAACLVPSFALGMAAAPSSDLIVVAGLLLLARVALALAALEGGTALGGVGASYSMTLAGMTEPAVLFAIFPLALLLGTTNLDAMEMALREGSPGVRLPLLLALAALAVVALARLRGVMPATQPFSEAAMNEDSVALDFTGRSLALVTWGSMLSRLVWLSLIANLAVPAGLMDATGNPAWWAVGVAIWAVKIAVLSAALAMWPAGRVASTGRLVEILGLAALLGLLASVLLFAAQGLA